MRLAGLVGGLGPESTVDYYKRIVALWRARTNDGSYPRLVLSSMDLGAMLVLLNSGALDRLTDALVAEVERLARAGADFAALTANTPHVVFDQIKVRSPIPLISIVETCRDEMIRQQITSAALLGTQFTMQARFYPDVCAASGITIVTPRADEQSFIHDKYMSELIRGEFHGATRNALKAIVRRMIAEHRIGGVILGGTELPLVLTGNVIDDVPLLDTTAIHVAAIVDEMHR
jgi:aspartate racemase